MDTVGLSNNTVKIVIIDIIAVIVIENALIRKHYPILTTDMFAPTEPVLNPTSASEASTHIKKLRQAKNKQ